MSCHAARRLSYLSVSPAPPPPPSLSIDEYIYIHIQYLAWKPGVEGVQVPLPEIAVSDPDDPRELGGVDGAEERAPSDPPQRVTVHLVRYLVRYKQRHKQLIN